MSDLTYNMNNNNSSSYPSTGYGDSSSNSTYNVSTYLSCNTTDYSHIQQIYQACPTMITTQGSTYYSQNGLVKYHIYG